MNPTQQSPTQNLTNFNHLQDMGMNLLSNICAIVVTPCEMALRPRYGTRYIPPPVLFFSMCVMVALPLLSALAGTIGNMIPFARFRGPVGMFGIGTFTKLFFLGAVIHGIRLWRLMMHPEKEENSYWEGSALPIFNILPGASFWRIRILFEPALLFILGVALPNVFILQSSAAHYLIIAAFMLAAKEFIAWYRNWEIIRNALDMRSAAPLLAKFVDNTATQDELARIHLASFPKNAPEEVRQAAATHVAKSFAQ